MSVSVPILMLFSFLTHFPSSILNDADDAAAAEPLILLPSRSGIALTDEQTLNIGESYGNVSKSSLCPVLLTNNLHGGTAVPIYQIPL